jgi:hypothetical protein
MPVELVIEHRDVAQDFEQEPQYVLEGFFSSSPRARRFSNPGVLAECGLFDLSISFYMRDWPGPMLHPGIFEEFFPLILHRLIESDSVLTLHVHGLDPPGHFDAREHVETQLKPRGLAYLFLPDRTAQPDSAHQPEYLFFEWPRESLNYIAQEGWLYHGPWVETEGYVSKGPLLDVIARLHAQADDESRIRELLRSTDFCFRTWPDGNAVRLLTDKLDLRALKERLRLDELNRLIQEATQQYDGTAEPPVPEA